MLTRICKKCKTEKPRQEFRVRHNDSRDPWCWTCRLEYLSAPRTYTLSAALDEKLSRCLCDTSVFARSYSEHALAGNTMCGALVFKGKEGEHLASLHGIIPTESLIRKLFGPAVMPDVDVLLK